MSSKPSASTGRSPRSANSWPAARPDITSTSSTAPGAPSRWPRDSRPSLSTGKDRTESCIGQDLCHLLPLVPLDFDAAVLDRAAAPAGRAHLFGELLLLRLTN